ncbi:hypothetical protein HW115_01555 [Verrucomicrobiaceae bacterium N1E253]|uniref:Uncharacterized protein n=1 Tax=Oceaniferula marina TaxID=2748318 RepID=A0A851GAQ9_9BACT|nr:hypothetical protein [Oceaniferula marina]NWK54279.1 hypothetical protein [Oceaniferula marina]
MEHSLDEELRVIEMQLTQLSPQRLSGDLLSRMEMLMQQWEVQPDAQPGIEQLPEEHAQLTDLELHLDQLSPAPMPDDLLLRMSQAMDSWQHQEEAQKHTISFPARKSSRHGNGMLKAAAAMALLGVLSAWFWNPGKEQATANLPEAASPGGQDSRRPDSGQSNAISSQWLKPDTYSHKVTHTSDSGVIMTRDNVPHRCIRVEYIDRIKVKDDDGREIEIKSPGVDFMLIPVETN